MEKFALTTSHTPDEMVVRMISHYLAARMKLVLNEHEWGKFLACIEFYLFHRCSFIRDVPPNLDKATCLEALSLNTPLDGLQCIQALALIDDIIDEWRETGRMPFFNEYS